MRYGKIARACTYIKNLLTPRRPTTINKVQPMSKLDRQFWDLLHRRKEK